ncbi:hypothetical protein GCM10023191_073930 [Actinoallomurus oryzae]|uniref:Uncharacterized protein n=1 Tax=Actinoallomurus oryzae TaxID=502180 RepID=A0ABP8QT92_9ACTN
MTVQVDALQPYARVTRHLQQLEKALRQLDITAFRDLDMNGGSRIALLVYGAEITCRTNPADAHHYWYWWRNEPVHPAHGMDEAREAAEKLQQQIAQVSQ